MNSTQLYVVGCMRLRAAHTGFAGPFWRVCTMVHLTCSRAACSGFCAPQLLRILLTVCCLGCWT